MDIFPNSLATDIASSSYDFITDLSPTISLIIVALLSASVVGIIIKHFFK